MGTNLKAAFAGLLSQELSVSTGYVAALMNGCLFTPSLLTFWFVNGVLDFSTAVAIGAVSGPAGLQVRVVAYVLLVPTFLLLRASFHLAHPVHRRQVLAGTCPQSRFLSLDWFSVGILSTGLPLALQSLGPWLAMNAIFLVGLFGLPRFLSPRRANALKFTAIVAGVAVFLYANYGGVLAAATPLIPAPAAVLGPVATLALSDATTSQLLEVTNSLLTAPLLIAVVAVSMNRILTHPELADLPLVRHSLPDRDPTRIVATSAALGTVFYLSVVAAATGDLVVVPG